MMNGRRQDLKCLPMRNIQLKWTAELKVQIFSPHTPKWVSCILQKQYSLVQIQLRLEGCHNMAALPFREWLHSICIVELPTHYFVYSDFASALACCFASRFESASVFLVWPVIFGALGFAAGYGLCRTSLFVCTTSLTILPRSFFDFQTSCFSSSAFKSLSEAVMGYRMSALVRHSMLGVVIRCRRHCSGPAEHRHRRSRECQRVLPLQLS